MPPHQSEKKIRPGWKKKIRPGRKEKIRPGRKQKIRPNILNIFKTYFISVLMYSLTPSLISSI